MGQGFDNNKYLKMQSKEIAERIGKFGDKLYLEFGGKLFDDFHASRVLPGFQPDSKIKMLLELKDNAEIIIVINSEDIENKKVRGDIGITYDLDVFRLIDVFVEIGLYVGSVILTRFDNQPHVLQFEAKLKSFGIKSYRHYTISGYPMDVKKIVSDKGYGKNDYIETKRPLVVVTAPGPGSGKMAVCLSQLYHDNQRGIQAGYAKFETFPIWNLPLKHPVNLAYEAATADLNDINMIDPYHLEAYGETTVNYNRDIEIFPVLKTMFEEIYGESPYQSPTDMGVNMAGHCIHNDDFCQEASCQEIIRRFYEAQVAQERGEWKEEVARKISLLMNTAKVTIEDREIAVISEQLEEKTGEPAAAIRLKDGKVITGKTSQLLGASASVLLNALKYLAGINDEIDLLSRDTIKSIQSLKITHFGNNNPRLHTDEVLIALSISASTDELAKKAFDKVSELCGCEIHSSVIISQVDELILKKLGTHLTYTPKYQSSRLYRG